jgi:HK97 family phage prohead protease
VYLALVKPGVPRGQFEVEPADGAVDEAGRLDRHRRRRSFAIRAAAGFVPAIAPGPLPMQGTPRSSPADGTNTRSRWRRTTSASASRSRPHPSPVRLGPTGRVRVPREALAGLCPALRREREADGPESKPYRQLFRPGAFREQIEQAQSTPLRIWVNIEHRRGLASVIGHAVRLLDLPGGLYGSFQVHKGTEGDEALAAVREGVLAGVSMQATPLRSRPLDGVTERLRAHLNGVSLVGQPAYADAKVLEIRRERRDDQPPPASEAEVLL